MSTVEMDQAAPESAAHHPLPDPGESVPRLALPTIGIFLATLTAFVGSTTAYISGWIPFWVTIPVNAAVTFVMFTVVHDASHYAISSIRWVNGLFGRLAWLFVGPVVAFPAFGYIHIQHHRHSNDDEQDPDTFASHGSLWVLPLRWSMVEYFYIKYYLPRGRSRPVIEVAETLVMMTLFLTGLIVAIVTGNFWTPPTGRFGTPLDPLHRKHYVGLVAGSGITPVLSILATTLEIETESRFTLIYGNRTKESTMFRAELDRLESRYADRLEILHVLSSEPLHTPELRGRIDRDKLTRWLTSTLRPAGVDEWFICGPLAMATAVRETLIEHGVDSERIHLELFYGFDTPPATRPSYAGATVTFTLSGQRAIFDLVPGDSILEGALGLRSDAPYACMGGACGTCRAKLIEGNVEMDHNFALRKAELDAGYILTCQSHPTTPFVAVDYDA
ncbi:electron transfer protein FDXB [Mycobacterium tuberculosis]|nr:electron transfer protein FDXB [Mycobacterium tuberculosis]CNZ39145.1 electron transfer protein FDXB [Mycobacterium tuberculosis]